MQVSIGFTHSEVDPRQKFTNLGVIEVDQSDAPQIYTLESFPDELPREMSRALDRPFFLRLTNRSKTKIHLDAFDYEGNVNTELTSSLIPDDLDESDVDDHVRQSINAFVERAFRRSPTAPDFAKYYDIYQQHVTSESRVDALLSTYKEILCSPGFFYLGLSGDQPDAAVENYKLAERLAFFLWCSVPDDRLLEAASARRLTDPAGLASQVDRMLARRQVETMGEAIYRPVAQDIHAVQRRS